MMRGGVEPRLRCQLPWDVSNVAAAAARAALGAPPTSSEARTAARQHVALAQGAPRPNFLCAELGADVAPVIEGLRDRGVRVGRRFASLPTHLRVTIGTAQEMRAFLAAFDQVWSSAQAA
jgi:histidinol-phosphate aminotransferase